MKNIDWQILGISILISVIGSIALLSTTVTISGGLDFGGIFLKQLAFIASGLIIYYFVSKSDITYFKYLQVSVAFALLVLVLLIVTKLFGPNINQAQRWLVIAGIQIQPSEFAKIAIIPLTLSILNWNKYENIWMRVLISFIPAFVFALLIYFQPHTTMALLIFLLWGLTVFTYLPNQLRNILLLVTGISTFIGTVLIFYNYLIPGVVLLLLSILISIFAALSKFKDKRLFAIILGFTLILGIIGSLTFKYIPQFSHQEKRIQAFLNPTDDLEGKAFNVNQAKIAIGSGQIWGKGFGFGTQSKLNFLPEHQTDFIFAAYAEEFGLLGSIFIIGLYSWLIMRIFLVTLKLNDPFFATVVLVLGLKILFEVFINIGTNTGIIPATGIPLPLFTAGGTITIATFFSLGMIQSIISNSQDVIDSGEIII